MGKWIEWPWEPKKECDVEIELVDGARIMCRFKEGVGFYRRVYDRIVKYSQNSIYRWRECQI
jgi:hypothetical protein